MKVSSVIPFEFDRAVFLEGCGLWLDPPTAKDFAFVSHAHADHYAGHGRILCSTTTRELILARYGARKTEFLALHFGESMEEKGHRLTLLPAGHIAGSAQILVEDCSAGTSLLYTGDFKTRTSLTAERIEIRSADVLIMETTFGLPRYQFPPADEVLSRLAAFAGDALEDGLVPVVLGYSLGKAQEIIAALHQRLPGVPFQVHSSVAEMNRVLSRLGVALPECEILDPDKSSPRGHIVVIPPAVSRSKMARSIPGSRSCLVTGWAVNPSARFRFHVDEVFPLSDHAGYDDLLSFVEAVNPRVTYTLHGSAGSFAADLRSRGREAWSLLGDNQMELNLGLSAKTEVPLSEDGPDDLAGGELAELAALCRKIRATDRKKEKRDLLVPYLRAQPKENLASACLFLAGRSFSPSQPGSARRGTGAGWTLIRRALIRAAAITEAEFNQLAASWREPSSIVTQALAGKGEGASASLLETREFFESLAELAGPQEKESLLTEWFTRLHHAESALLVGILLGDLRIGLGEALLEDAIAEAFEAPPVEVRKAQMYTGDLGLTAILACERRLDQWELTPFNPLSFMLASPAESAQELHQRLSADGTRPVWLEDKLDGVRAQLHKFEDSAAWFARDLQPLEDAFPELSADALQLADDVVLDGEIIAFAEGRKLSNADLQTRLVWRRHEGDLFRGETSPVQFVVFDLLWLNGRVLTETPLWSRREQLEKLGLPKSFLLSAVRHADSREAIDEEYARARERGMGGLVAKDPLSHYLPGTRGKSWLKLKKPAAVLTVTVVRASLGRRKSSGLRFGEYAVAVKDEESGAFRVIGAVSSGLEAEEFERLNAELLARSLTSGDGVHEIEPGFVLDVAFSSIHFANRHDSGLALRFPKILAVRRDKTLQDVDTLATARQWAEID